MIELIKNAPQTCGVYLFKKGNKVLYVGKAKNIKERLLQHYRQAQENLKERSIVSNSNQIDWIITKNEYEALVLEVDLIQLHKPKYNVLHKHGGGYPLIVITEDQFPTVKVVRGFQRQGKGFGPFFTAKKAYKVKKLIHKLFKLRTCDPMPVRKEPCMDYHLGLCSGPCAGLIKEKDYMLSVKSAQSLLSGQVSEILPELYQKLEEYMKELQFEKCAVLRDQIKALEKLSLGQSVSGLSFAHADVFYRMGRMLGIYLIRSSKLVDKETVILESEDEVEEVIVGFYYSNPIPETILLNFELSEEVIKWLSQKGKFNLSFHIDENLEKLIKENLGHVVPYEVLREEFIKLLKINAPIRIEGFDVSHFYGEYIVASCVVWEEGAMNKKRYRRYRIRTVNKIDDYAALEELLTRRARRLKEGEEPMPDVWLIDGGLGQLTVGIKVRDNYKLPIKVFSLAKENEILYTEFGVNIPLKEHPILYRVFGQIRDEAHRFALSYNKKLRLKEGLKDVLDRIKGIGEVKKKIIYNNFENLYELLKAEEGHLRRLGINPSIKQEIEKYIS
ncbi:excinuclease ABC subunit UvrC [Thermocrinis sp.]|uniref:excinuclease ABC subunit UvrC n=1 Tax=Thermocrinis sp. TaxID=2024383 RepID=UPI002FDD498F